MKRRFIPVEESFQEWRKDPDDVATHDAMEAEFALASALIKLRSSVVFGRTATAARDTPKSAKSVAPQPSHNQDACTWTVN